ncbi:urease accessory protein UreE [Pseudooctadecabacter sp.]|uniref:urease accessory protein UreE n=1 Tax=Pseudooctadecabacter sp. TaxID=1966338 RepID=UPI00399C5FD4
MADMTAQDHAHQGAWADPVDVCVMTYDERFLRRKVVQTVGGLSVLVDFAHTTSLDHGDALRTTDGTFVEIQAADEALMKVTGDLVRLAWHIGNRHTPCQIEADHLLIQTNKVMRDMLGKLGAQVEDVTMPFTPEGGAYGHGRTHGHDHGASHGGDHGH